MTWAIRSPEDVARAVAGARSARGLTQAELAEQTGIARGYLAKLESGASTPMVLDRTIRLLRRMGATITITIEVGDG